MLQIEELRARIQRRDMLSWAEMDALLSAAAERDRLQADLREANAVIRELQQEACDRAGVPMPSQRPVVDRLRAEIERLREVARNLANAADDVGVKFFDTDTIDPLVERMQTATSAARAALSPQPQGGEQT